MDGKVFMGVDPGATGAMVTVGEIECCIRFSKVTDVDLWKGIMEAKYRCYDTYAEIVAILEKVSIMPMDGRGSGGKFMANFGMLRGFLIAAEIRFIEVTPVVWCRKMGRIDPKGTTKTVKKRRNQELAQHLYPDRGVIRETCDAFLLAEYGRRFHE